MNTTDTIDEQFAALTPDVLPNHVAIIPNGHRTWAKKHGKKATEAHRVGMEILVELSRFFREIGVHTLTVWGMSTENFTSRPEQEVKGLMKLMKHALNTWAQELADEGARIVHLGRKDRLPEDIRILLTQWEEKTAHLTAHCANIAFDYGGHDEILRAMKAAFADIEAGNISFDDLYNEVGSYHGKYPYFAFKDYLDTADQPYPFPDLIIRSSGEQRLSGFMPWQSVYSEFYAAPEHVPEFTEETVKKALLDYANRKRTFGGN